MNEKKVQKNQVLIKLFKLIKKEEEKKNPS